VSNNQYVIIGVEDEGGREGRHMPPAPYITFGKNILWATNYHVKFMHFVNFYFSRATLGVAKRSI